MNKLAVFFPGIGYTVDKPLLYYTSKLTRAAGFENIPLRFSGFPSGVRSSADKMRQSCQIALDQTRRQLQDVNLASCDTILFISKSIGTIIAAQIQKEQSVRAHNVYFTPLADTFRFMRPASGIAFHGTKDPWTNDVSIDSLCRQYQIPVCDIPDANHSLETGNLRRDLAALARVMEFVQDYIRAC